jgi:selenocysteine-specific elongation factor
MKNIIVGTAGHIDHGKTSLIRALTGIDTDRLEEEKRRGITIDLGFAHLQLTPEIRLGFVDVPGHERFVKNMLAGAAGIDLVLFVVAADESVKPQTREHFDICRLLGIRSGVIALTKIDAVDTDLLELTRLEVHELVAGSFLDSAPVLPVSSRTGAGLEELRAALTAVSQQVPAKDPTGPARLPIDRAFSMRGFGTVITGTLLSGTIRRDQELVLLPGNRAVRVRGIEAYGTPADHAVAGMRTALNVPDIEAKSIVRGMAIVERGRFATTKSVDCVLEWLPSAPKVKNRMPVHFHTGTSNTVGEVRMLGECSRGSNTFLSRILLKESIVAAFGDRFIARRFSPVVTVGGGVILDSRPTKRANKHRLGVLAGNDTLAMVELLIDEAEWGVDPTDLAARLGLSLDETVRLAVQCEAVVLKQQGWLIDRARVQQVSQHLIESVAEFHRSTPMAAGVLTRELRNLFRSAPVFVIDAVIAATPELVVQADLVRMRSHVQSISAEEDAARRKLSGIFENAGFAVPSVTESLASTGLNPERAKAILQTLLRSGVLIRINDDLLLHSSMLTKLREIFSTKSGSTFTVSEFKEWTGVSRKYAVPILEFADRQKLTRRSGESRVVLPTKPSK